jgi:glycerol uptake facilitator-like aquaporin
VFLAELIGTAMLAFVIAMASLQITYAEGQAQPVNQLLSIFLPIVIGTTLTFLIYVFRGYTSAHFNPAVSLAVFLKSEISILRLVANWLAQFLGAFVGVSLVSLIFSSSKYGFAQYDNLIETLTANDLTTTSIAVLEAIGVFILVLGIFTMMRQKNSANVGPIIAGISLALGIFLVQPFTFAVLNPAVAVALRMPAVYWFAPMLGGVVATLVLFALDGLANRSSIVPATESKKKK